MKRPLFKEASFPDSYKVEFVNCSETIPVHVTTGPVALASAPSDRNIPSMVPFCSTPPYDTTTVVMHGTTVAEPAKLILFLHVSRTCIFHSISFLKTMERML